MKTRLRELRKERGLTVQELADKCDCSKGAIVKYESDYLEMGYEMLFKICNIFDCSLDYLLCRTDLRKYDLDKIKATNDVYFALANEMDEMTQAQRYEVLAIVQQIVKMKK